jgi:hypothetical protein
LLKNKILFLIDLSNYTQVQRQTLNMGKRKGEEANREVQIPINKKIIKKTQMDREQDTPASSQSSLSNLKVGSWIKYGFQLGQSKKPSYYWYFGQITKISEKGIGDDGDPYILADIDFPEEPEYNVTIWSNKEHIVNVLGWEMMTEDIALGHVREKFTPEINDPEKNKNINTTSNQNINVDLESKINLYFAEYRAKHDDLKEKVDGITKTQKDYEKKIDNLKSQVSRITNQYQRFITNTQEHNLKHLCEQYMPCSVLKEDQITENHRRFVYPPMLEGNKNVPEWKIKLQCCHMFSWNGDGPECKAARLYKKGLKTNKKGEQVASFKLVNMASVEDDDEHTYYWLMNPNARPLSYNILISRLWRKEHYDKAIQNCHDYAVCHDCVLHSGKQDEYVSTTQSGFCHICVRHITITTSFGSQDRNVEICAECNAACGKNDDLRFMLRIVKHLFPLNNVVINKNSLDRNTPDTTIEFNSSLTEQSYTILIEMDTAQHRGVSAKQEVDKKEEMTKTILVKNKHARVFIIRFCPGGDFRNRSGVSQGTNVLTTAQRLQILRSWIIWYIATAEYGVCPPFLVLYLWYNYNGTKVGNAKDRLGNDFIGQSFGYPKHGVWKYYASSPDEQKIIKGWDFNTTGCRGENVEDVFPSYNEFAALKLPASIQD